MLTRAAILSKSGALIRALRNSRGTRQNIVLKDINDLIKEHPQSAELFRSKLSYFVKLSNDDDETLSGRARQTLALMSYARPPKAPGLRVLSIDGGGTRGLVSLEILRHIEKKTNKRIHQLFDLICGVSSGSIITMAIGSGCITLDQCDKFYRDMSENIFKSDFWTSTPRLLLNHAYYDASVFEKTLRQVFGNTTLLQLASQAECPKLAAIAVNAHTVKPFLFRNYCDNPLIGTKFDGTCKAEVWQAIRSSTAAPGFFQEFKFNSSILVDGGILVNNCTAVAHTEARLLWPKEKIHCIVSVGSGKFKQSEVLKSTATSLYEKAYGILYSATDTETVHVTMHNLVPSYYRFNPPLSENLLISENRKMKLEQLKQEAKRYMLNNEPMLNDLVTKLTKPRRLSQRILDYCLPISH